jgi:Domain of unknown function (DUF4136)
MLGKVVLTSWLVALPAIAMADVRVDYDRYQDVSKYRTFNVEVGPLVRPDGSTDEQNTLAENRIRNAVTSELLARGLEPTDSGASLVVRVSGRDTERVSIISTGWPPIPATGIDGGGTGARTDMDTGERRTTATSGRVATSRAL